MPSCSNHALLASHVRSRSTFSHRTLRLASCKNTLGHRQSTALSRAFRTSRRKATSDSRHSVSLRPFNLERFFADYEFSVQHLLCCSDCEPLRMMDLVSAADKEYLSMWDELSLAYTESRGHPVLREQIAALYDSVSPAEVLIGAPEELIFLAMTALLRPGDVVVVTFPAYQSLYEVAQSRGCQLRLWEPRTGPSGALSFAVEDLERLLAASGPRANMLVINFPHNPTGDLLSRSSMDRVVELARRHGSWIFSDEMYRGLELDQESRIPSAVDLYDRGITLCGLSKVHGCPGLRIGWLLCHDASAMSQIAALKDYTTICNSATSEVLAIMALHQADALAAKSMDILKSNIEIADSFFAKHRGVFDWTPPIASSVAFPRLLMPEQNIAEWTNQVRVEAGVLLLPATIYEHEPSIQEKRFRIGLGRKSFAAGLSALDEWLQKQQL